MLFHFHPGPNIHVSSPSRSHLDSHPDQDNCISLPSRSHPTITQDMIFMSHLQPGLTIQVTSHPHLHSANCISVLSRSHLIPSRPQGLCLTSIKAPFYSHPYLKSCISPASRFHLICTQVPRFSSHLSVTPPLLSRRQDCISPASRSHLTPSRFLKFVSRLHPGHISSPPRSRYSCHISIQVTSRLHPGPDPGPENCISPPSKYHLTCIRVPGFTSHSHLLLCHVSPPFMSQESRLSSIHVPSHFIHFLNFICDSPPSRLCLTSTQNLIQMHKGPNMHVSPPSMMHLTSIQVMRTASHPF